MKQLVKKLLLRSGYQISNLQIRHRDIFADQEFANVYSRARESTATPVEGIYALYTLTRYLAGAGVPGALVDGAAWKCGGTIAMLETLRTIGKTDREVFAFDLFDQPDRQGKCYWDAVDFQAVKERVYKRDYPKEQIQLVAGDILDTVPGRAPSQIALLRMDAGRAEVTRHLLRELYPHVSPGGCVFVNDYGSYFTESGKAAEEFLATLNPRPLVHRVDQYSRYWLKL
ncbi:MAG TPA: TylF/MycF/NovP-related O-methyltransferase [Chthoniobacter sp.]|nr:TylF/MycF/NovP-related O-methyltransferase [Chthoniobacter sp.]